MESLSQVWSSVVLGLKEMVTRFQWIDLVDILLIAILIYYVLKLASKTRAMQVLKGLGVMLVAARVASFFNLRAFSWTLNYIISVGALLMVVLFQPEIRRALEQLGRGKILETSTEDMNVEEVAHEITAALLNLSKRQEGALIVLSRQSGLEDIIETGTYINSLVSSQLLESIFMPGTPLHDGAVVIKENKIAAASCFLPLTTNTNIPQELGTRHRAALGISEISDAIAFTVSEETGTISVAVDGKLIRNLNAASIRSIVLNEDTEVQQKRGIFDRLNKTFRRKDK